MTATDSSKPIRFIILALAVCLLSTNAAGEGTQGRNVVVMLIQSLPKTRELERALQEQLALELESYSLMPVDPWSFASDDMPRRIEEIRPIAQQHGADMVIWLESIDGSTVSLQLAVMAPGRSTLSAVEARRDGDPVGELSISVREILKEIYLQKAEAEAAAGTVENRPTEQESKPGLFYLSLGADLCGGFTGTDVSPVLLGAAMSVGLGLPSGLHMDLSLTVFAAPAPSVADGEFSAVGIRPGVGIGFRFGSGSVVVGPYLGLQVPWQKATVARKNSNETTKSWWNFRTVPGLDFRFRLHRNFLLLLRPGVGLQVKQVVFKRESDGTTLYASPYVDWNVTAGIIFDFR